MSADNADSTSLRHDETNSRTGSERTDDAHLSSLPGSIGEQKKPVEPYKVKKQNRWQTPESVYTSSEMESETIEIYASKTRAENMTEPRRANTSFGTSWRDRKAQSHKWISKELPVNTRFDSLRSSSYGHNKSSSQKSGARPKQSRSDQVNWRSSPRKESFELQDDDALSDLSDEEAIIDAMLPNPEKVLFDVEESKLSKKGTNSSLSNIKDKRKQLENDSKKQRVSSIDIIQAERRGGRKSQISKTLLMKKLTLKGSKSVLIEMTKSDTALKDCIGKARESFEYMEVFLDLLARAYTCDTIPNAMIMLFETLKENKFFDALAFFLLDMQERVAGAANVAKYEKVLMDILNVVIAQITRNPSSISVFTRVYTALGQIINEMKVLDDYVLKDDIHTQFKLIADRKKAAEKLLKYSSATREKIEPPEDFRIIEVTPSANELRTGVKPFLRPNKIEGEYENLDHYLDVQFRLLREDFVCPLREGISEYIKANMDKEKNKGLQSFRSDIKIYTASVHSPVVTEHGFCYRMKLEMSPLLRRTNWSSSKRLIYGSLVCLTEDEFSTFTLATVVGRDDEDIKRGLFTIQLDRSIKAADLLHKVFKIAETSAYFESYKHVLTGLQAIKAGDMPFEKYIVRCESKIDKPAYITEETTYDLRPLVDQDKRIVTRTRLPDLDVTRKWTNEEFDEKLQEHISLPVFSQKAEVAKCVNVLDTDGWPAKEFLHLDESQYRAVQTALTKEFSIIQGPPGTGKTYIGLQIARALLHNMNKWKNSSDQEATIVRPMLIVCYTNHALDQFLEGIHKFFKGDILRVGGRSKSEVLERCNLKRYRLCNAVEGTPLWELKRARLDAKKELDQHSTDVALWAKSLELYQSELVHENYMFSEMNRRFYNNLRQREKNSSSIVKWLGIAAIIAKVKRNIKQKDPMQRSEQLFVKVEDELSSRRNFTTENASDEYNTASKNEHCLVKQIREETIAFFVEEIAIPVGTKHTEEIRKLMKEKDYRRYLKNTIQAQIVSSDIMTQEEASRIGDIWRLKYNDRWRLYRLWLRQLCGNIYIKIESKRVDFEAASERYRDALLQEDKEVMRNASVIGMTTSGAAKYQSVLKEIEPKIIIVEEAAEVLEAHVVTTLSKGCEHLILIGDHKQLRPNPTVYRLAVRYNLNISLFERMVENGIKVNSLELQHRMRPEIAAIIRHIYPELKDHDIVKSYPNVKGISSNLFFVHHTQPEEGNDDVKSYSNPHEALFATALCRYLILQGYEKERITVLTTYTGQLMCLRNQMPYEEFNGVKVTVVDNYQGEENDFVILSLVRSNQDNKIGFLKTDNRACVALSRAKIGFFIIGNSVQLAANSNLWESIVNKMTKEGKLGKRLKLYCQNHPTDDAIEACEGKDFKKAPNGGCSKKCDARLDCGHVCKMFCHVTDTQHVLYKCRQPCNRVICEDHKCPDDCYKPCRPCQVLVTKTIPSCQHEQRVPCSQGPSKFVCQIPCKVELKCGHCCREVCGKPHTKECKVKIENMLQCGHVIEVECYKSKRNIECHSPCEAQLKCKHACKGTCGRCFRGRTHVPCKEMCKQILVCGHECSALCNNCPPCMTKCENRCAHTECQGKCGEPCVQCHKPCEWSCAHFQCTKLCFEPCDRPRCNEPCDKSLSCGHPCMGLCGEPCADFFCRKCDTDLDNEITHKNDPATRFVYLEDCGHNVESKAMDSYMDKKDEDRAIQLKCCPQCNTPIRRCLRYGAIIKETLLDIERVKTTHANKLSITTLQNTLTDTFKTDPVYKKISRDLKINSSLMGEKYYRNLYKDRYMKWKCITVLYNRLSKFKKEMCTADQIITVENQRTLADAVVDVISEIENKTQKISSKRQDEILSFLYSLCNHILTEKYNFSEQEFDDCLREIHRGNNYIRFLNLKEAISTAAETVDAKEHMKRIENIMLEPERYTEEKADQVKQYFDRLVELTKIDGLVVSEETQLHIIKSVGLSKDHWLKCENNHIYVTGELRRATECVKCLHSSDEVGGNRQIVSNSVPEITGAEIEDSSQTVTDKANVDLGDLQ